MGRREHGVTASGTGWEHTEDVYGEVRDEVRFDDEDESCGCGYGESRGHDVVYGGSEVPVTQTGIGDYAFTGWSGACSGTGACTVTMDSSKEVTANYVLGLKYTVETNPAGREVTVDGQTYPSPKTFTWIPGSTHTIGVASPQAGTTGTRYVYQSWGDGGAQTHTVTVPQTTATYTVNFTTQYQLTTG